MKRTAKRWLILNRRGTPLPCTAGMDAAYRLRRDAVWSCTPINGETVVRVTLTWDDGKPVDCPGGHGAQCCGEPEACRAALDKSAKRKRGKA